MQYSRPKEWWFAPRAVAVNEGKRDRILDIFKKHFDSLRFERWCIEERGVDDPAEV